MTKSIIKIKAADDKWRKKLRSVSKFIRRHNGCKPQSKQNQLVVYGHFFSKEAKLANFWSRNLYLYRQGYLPIRRYNIFRRFIEIL